jgi:hypothetical protein
VDIGDICLHRIVDFPLREKRKRGKEIKISALFKINPGTAIE